VQVAVHFEREARGRKRIRKAGAQQLSAAARPRAGWHGFWPWPCGWKHTGQGVLKDNAEGASVGTT